MRTIWSAAFIVFAAACSSKPKPPTVVEPGGYELTSTIVTLSSFWPTLDSEACPLVKRRASAPEKFKVWWPGLVEYCKSKTPAPALVTLAGEVDREKRLADLIAALRGEVDVASRKRDDACARLKDLANDETRKLVEAACNREQIGDETVDNLKSAARTLDKRVQTARELASTPQLDCGKVKLMFAESADKPAAACDRGDAKAAKKQFQTFIANEEAKAKALHDLADSAEAIQTSPATVTPIPLPSVASASPMLDVALQALAQFLVKRAEMELRAFAIDKLRKVAECAKSTDASVVHRLLSHTCEYLGGDSDSLPAGFGPGLRAAFVQDILALPRSIVREAPASGGTKQLIARLGLEAAAMLLEDPEPIQVVQRMVDLASSAATGFACSDNTCTATKLAIERGAMIARDVLLDGPEIRITGRQLIRRLAERLAADLHDAPADALEQNLASLQAPASDLIAELRAARSSLLEDDKGVAETRALLVLTAAKHTLRAADRAIAIGSCVELLVKTHGGTTCAGGGTYLPGGIIDFLDALRRKDIGAVATAGLVLIRPAIASTDTSKLLTPDVTRLVTFGAELANAKTKDEAEAAIETIAMPPGGYKEKRRRDMLSITSFVGVAGGYELVSRSDAKGWTSSIAGTVGLDFNHHITGSPWTVGAYITVLDLGGIMNVGDDNGAGDGKSINDSPQVGFAQVFAPGVGLRTGISDSPLVLMAGVQVVPHARTVVDDMGTSATDDDTSSEHAVVRAMVTIGVDVTLWAF